MNATPRLPLLRPVTTALLVSALAFADAGTIRAADSRELARSSAGPPVPAIAHVATNGPALLLTEMIQAKAAADPEVLAAAGYNLLHLRAVSPDETVARPALEELANAGDAFTLRWLDAPGHRTIPVARQPLVNATRERIRERLTRVPSSPEPQVEAWLLRSAVSDLTCNALEAPLGRFRAEWLQEHRGEPAVRSQLETLAASLPLAAGPVFGPGSVRQRARAYCGSALNPPPPTVKGD